ncbi:MAG: hypothetical protein Kow0083_01450 [Methylophaga sp.]
MQARRDNTLRACLLRLLLTWVCLLLSFDVQAASAAIDLADLDWEYRWEERSLTDDEPLVSSAAAQWHAIDFPANPPDRGKHDLVWFRTVLPEARIAEPVIFITSIDLNVEAYLDDKLIYRFGQLAAEDGRQFMGWPWHQIALPEAFAGKTLSFRIYSNYTDIGLWGEIRLMSRSDMLLHVISSGLHELIVAALSLLVAFVTLVFALFRGTQKTFFYLGLFSLAIAGSLLGENLTMQLVFPWPLLKTYLAAVSYFSMPIFMAMLLYHWLAGAKGSEWVKKVAQFHLAYLLFAILLSLTEVVNLALFFPIFDGLFIVSLFVMMLVTLRLFRQLGFSQQLVLGAFAVYGVFLILDMLVAHSILIWIDFPVAIGGLIFALVLIVISLHSYVQTNRDMELLNQHLEQRVTERTAELHAYAEEEQRQRKALERENQLSTELEQFNVELQSCSTLAEATELMMNRLATVFRPTKVQVKLGPLPDVEQTAKGVIRLQHLGGNSQALASLSFKEDDAVLSRTRLENFIRRTAQQLTVSMSNIKLREDLQRYSFEDALTGLRNRRFFDEALTRDVQLAQRHQTALTLLICDIDNFKQFNDDYGHEAGDMALKAVADILQQHFRESDIPCRLGGEEFVVFMRDASMEDAVIRAEALRRAVEEKEILFHDRILSHLTISVGLASLRDPETDAETLLRQADKALYTAKQRGRNRVEYARDSKQADEPGIRG